MIAFRDDADGRRAIILRVEPNGDIWPILLKNSVSKIGGVLFAIYAHFHTLDMRGC